MAWIDIAILALVVLFGLTGILRGAKKSLLSLGAFAIAFVVAFFLSGVVAEALVGIDSVRLFVLGNGNMEEGFSLAGWIYAGFGNTNAGLAEDAFLFKNFLDPINKIIEASTVTTVGFFEGRAMYIAFVMFSAICGVGIFLVARFLLMIVTAIIKSFIGKKKSVVSRLTGFLIMAAQGGVFAFALMLVFTCFGGLAFAPGFNVVEAEFEHPNAIFSNYMYEGAYYLRNKLYLPDTEAYGRMVNLVYNTGDGSEPEAEHLTGERLELFIAVQNLRYENDPWSIDPDTKKRVFDQDNAIAVDYTEFADVGFDEVVEEILKYYEHAASIINNPDNLTGVTSAKFAAYKAIVNGNTQSVQKTMTELLDRLRGYKADYEAGTKLTDQNAIIQWNTNVLTNDYNRIGTTMKTLENICADLEADLSHFPNLDSFKPDRVNAGPKAPGEEGGETPPTGGEVTPPDSGDGEEGGETPPTGGEVTPPDGGDGEEGGETPPTGGEVTPPDGGDGEEGGETPPTGGEVTPPDGGDGEEGGDDQTQPNPEPLPDQDENVSDNN